MTAVPEINVTMSYHLLSKKDTAKQLGFTVRTLDRLVAGRKIPYVQIPTGVGDRMRTMFVSSDIDTWLDQRRKEAMQ